MGLLGKALLGAGLALAVAGGAQAQGDSGGQQLSSFQLMTGRVIVVSPNGQVVMRALDAPGMADELMKDARPMASGGIIFMHDNKLYAAQNRPMPGGAMLSDMLTRSPAGR